jgi:hypothetical protein
VSGGTPQTYANHLRWVPQYHFVILPILAVNVIWALWQAYVAFSFASAWAVAMALALLGLGISMRTFVLSVQNRVIRLEMRLRLERVLPKDLASRIPELSVGQLIALRFASDGELPALVREVLESGLRDGAAIKKKVRDWQPDRLRA